MVRLFALALSLTLGSGCSGSLPSPRAASHPGASFVEVPYPPPAALVEIVPKPPDREAVWVDGYWVWRGRSYVWQRGGWVHAAQGAAYATWQARVAPDGRLLFAPGIWYDAQEQPLEPPPVLVSARTPPNQATAENEVAR